MVFQKEQRTAISHVDFYFEDWLTGASELTPEQRGVFVTLCAIYYSKQGRVSENDRRLAGLCDLSVRKWRIIKSELVSLGKISFIDGLLYQERCEIELVNALKAKSTAQENGSKGGRKSAEIRANMLKRNGSDSSNASTDASSVKPATLQPPSPSPSPNKESPPSPPEGESGQDDLFELFWKQYPFVSGNPKEKAREEFVEAVDGRGDSAQDIIDAAGAYRKSLPDNGPPEPCHAWKFLNERRYKDDFSAPIKSDKVLNLRPPTSEEAKIWKEKKNHIPEMVDSNQPWPLMVVANRTTDGKATTYSEMPYDELEKHREEKLASVTAE